MKKKVRDIIDSHLKDEEYADHRVAQWIDHICEDVIEELHSTRKPFKYIVHCTIMQRTGSALHSSKSAYWDSVSDGSITVTWPKRNAAAEQTSKTIICMVTVFACSFYVN